MPKMLPAAAYQEFEIYVTAADANQGNGREPGGFEGRAATQESPSDCICSRTA